MKKSRQERPLEEIVDFFMAKGASKAHVILSDGAYANSVCRITLRKSGGLGALVSFGNMKWVSELLHTEEINIENEYHNEGSCDTCDYGAYNEADLVCYNINLFNEK